MSKHTTKPTSAPASLANPFRLSGGLFAGGTGHGMDAWMRMNRAVIEGVVRMQQEAGRFAAQRLEEDLSRQQQILACRSPQDALELCAGYARQAVDDYSAQAGRLSEIASEIQHACAGYGELLAGDVVDATPSGEPAATTGQRRSAA